MNVSIIDDSKSVVAAHTHALSTIEDDVVRRLTLPPPYTTRNAERLYDTNRDALLEEGQVALDLSADADPDLSFIQRIEIARQCAATQSKSLNLEKPAASFISEKLKIAGLATKADDELHRFWFHREAC